jgi:hypothetical protein
MSSQRSILGKWLLHHRWEAHLVLPSVAGLVLVVLYFFMPVPIQKFIAPGFIELPFGSGRLLGLPHIAMGLCLAWSTTLAISTLVLTSDRSVWVASVLVLVVIVMSVLMWADGHSLLSRATALVRLTSSEGAEVSGILSQYQNLIGLAGLGLFTLFFFVAMPLVYGDSTNPVVAMLIPSRWLALTSGVMFGVFLIAFRLQQKGWDQVGGQSDMLATNLGLLVKPILVYMLLLYLARLQYLTWVRKEAQHWNPANRFR